MDGLKARLSFDAVAYDYDDEYLTIDTDTHIININNVSRLFGVQYDGNSKLIKFRIRNKLSDIQKMQDSIVYINWIDSRGVKGQSIAINKTINNDTCEFAWKVPFDALKNSGVLHFAMSAVVTKNSSSVIDQRWSTQIASVITPDGIYIKSYTPSSEEEDRIAQIYNELSNMINKQNDNLSDMQSQVNLLHKDIEECVNPEQEIYNGSINQEYSFTASVLQGNIIVVEKIDATNFSGNFITVKCYSVYQDKPDKLRLVLNIRQYDSENNNLGSVDISSSYSAKMKIYPNTSYLQIRYYFEHTFSSMENVSFGYKGLHLYKGPLLLNKTIKVQKDFENLYSKIPTYYREHIKEKANYINNLWTAKDKKIIKSFAFITDFHGDAYYQTFNSQYLLKYLFETTPMDAVINGGDLITPPVESPYNYQECMAKIREYSDNSGAEAGCEYYFVAGNHDTGVNYNSDGQPTDKIIGQHELYSCCRNTRNNIIKDEKCPLQYYFDETDKKLRFIVLTGGLGELLNSETMQESLLWFAKALQSAPSGYTIIIVTHIIWTDKEHHTNAFTEKVFSYMKSYYNRSYVQETVDGERVDFSSCKGTIACLIGGHTHEDYSITNDKGQPIFTTTTDNFQAETGSLKRYGNGVTEQAFDVISIDTMNRKIYCTRIGAGSNREFSY